MTPPTTTHARPSPGGRGAREYADRDSTATEATDDGGPAHEAVNRGGAAREIGGDGRVAGEIGGDGRQGRDDVSAGRETVDDGRAVRETVDDGRAAGEIVDGGREGRGEGGDGGAVRGGVDRGRAVRETRGRAGQENAGHGRAAGESAGPWIRRFQPAPEAPVRLVCLPHAGGSAAVYVPFARALAPEADVLAIQYPGRQDRRAEPGITRLTDLADLVADALAAWTDRPLVVFGHSMGALLGYEVTARLEAAGTPPRALVASGRRAPSRHRAESVHRRTDEGVVRELRRLGGVDPAFLDEPELRAMILPAVRTDYEAIETYRHPPSAPLHTPLTVLTGDADPQVTPDEATAWADHTTGPFTLHTFGGGHFFINDHMREIQTILRGILKGAVPA